MKATPRLAILGAGPIGLEAGLYARHLELPFTIYERGRIGEHLLRWGHVKLFSPFAMNATSLGRTAIRAVRPGHAFPEENACITGREHANVYLAPLAETLGGHIVTDTAVLKVGRRGVFKDDSPGEDSRARKPFRLLLRDKSGRERIDEADVVLDCTGTYAQHRWLGDGGIPAAGELQAEPQISYGLDDILGDRRTLYANKTVLVVGAGYSAATTVVNLAQLALENQTTWGIWLARAPASAPLKRIANDPLKERDRLAVRANTLATRDDDNIEFHAGTLVEAVEFLGQERGFKVTARGPDKQRTWEVDRIIANVGYTPDTNLYRELQVHECYASLGPMKLAAALAGAGHQDCLKQTCHGADTLRSPEPSFYILGAKSYGRNSNFLLRIGFEQVREVFTLITGDDRLDLYKKK
jgi:thioredoxin reductase